ncbi:hypothetical protein, partial [Escherichia coli]|uniref:hypothetical protein n=1 Tax=Escherichia coli TaxID=562 RepID=UPI001BC831DE
HWSTSKTPSYTKSVSWQHHQEIPLCKKVHRHLIYPVPVATHQVVGRGIIFLFMGENLAFCASH